MPITKASGNSVTAAAKGDLVVGNATNDSGILAVGTTDQLLTVDPSTATGLKWVTPAGANANFTLLNSGGTAATGGTTVTISGISGKNSLYIFALSIGMAGSSSLSRVGLRLNTDSNANYLQSGFRGIYNSTIGNYQSGGDTFYNMANIDRGSSNNYFAVQIEGCNASGIKTISSLGSAQNYNLNGEYNMASIGHYTGTSAITSISFFTPDGANFDAGTIYVYGA